MGLGARQNREAQHLVNAVNLVALGLVAGVFVGLLRTSTEGKYRRTHKTHCQSATEHTIEQPTAQQINET
jgi:hypothetical protein